MAFVSSRNLEALSAKRSLAERYLRELETRQRTPARALMASAWWPRSRNCKRSERKLLESRSMTRGMSCIGKRDNCFSSALFKETLNFPRRNQNWETWYECLNDRVPSV